MLMNAIEHMWNSKFELTVIWHTCWGHGRARRQLTSQAGGTGENKEIKV